MKPLIVPSRQVLDPRGYFQVTQRDHNGVIKRLEKLRNAITNEGKDDLLGIMFNAATQITTWYIGLIDNAGFTTLDVTHTHDSHAGWTEFEDYSEATRPAWDEAAPSGQSIASSTPTDFSIDTDSSVINGIFVANLNTKGSVAAGTLWSEASFTGVLNADDGDTLAVTYQVDT